MRPIKIGKKAVSEMIAYVLLIVIAMSLSILVYAWLKGYIFKPEKICPDGVSLTIENIVCDTTTNPKTITLILRNNGLFDIEGFTARVKEDATKPAGYYLKLNDDRAINFDIQLEPNKNSQITFNYPKKIIAGTETPLTQIQKIEIQPIVIDEKSTILCENTYSQSVSNC